jgi:hypothetical protein
MTRTPVRRRAEVADDAGVILVTRSAQGWIVQVGVEGLCRFAQLGDARTFAASALTLAAANGAAARIVDLSRFQGAGGELLDDGQEEVFAAAEVEAGAIEHNVDS